MGLFKKKPDPISERAKLLTSQIAALETEIKKLAEKKSEAAPTPAPASAPAAPSSRSPFATPAPTPPRRAPAPDAARVQQHSQPRLRSTALPHGLTIPAASAKAQEPIFEEVGQNRIQTSSEPATPAHFNELGVRKYDLASAWQRLKNHFRGPVASNPKLVHYLSAGSIQGLRPLRYEKRVARNRFIFLVLVLVLVLWGILAVIFKR